MILLRTLVGIEEVRLENGDPVNSLNVTLPRNF